MTMPYNQKTTVPSILIERCKSGRACMDSCYYNGKLISCSKRNILKSVLFDPPFGETLPSVYLRLIQTDADDELLNPDITLKKENLTLYGMNIRFSLSINLAIHVFCADWLACSLDIN